MDLYLKHSRKYLALLRKVMKVTIHNTSYYDWEGNVSVEGWWMDISILYSPSSHTNRFRAFTRSGVGITTNSFREFLDYIVGRMPSQA